MLPVKQIGTRFIQYSPKILRIAKNAATTV